MIIESIVHVGICRHVTVEGEPTAKIYPRISGSVVDGCDIAKEKVRVRTLPYSGDTEKSTQRWRV